MDRARHDASTININNMEPNADAVYYEYSAGFGKVLNRITRIPVIHLKTVMLLRYDPTGDTIT